MGPKAIWRAQALFFKRATKSCLETLFPELSVSVSIRNDAWFVFQQGVPLRSLSSGEKVTSHTTGQQRLSVI